MVPANRPSGRRQCPATTADPYGEGRQHHPAVYTRLAPHYHRWLLEVTRGTTHCVPHRIFRDHHRRKLVAANRVQE